MSSTGQGPRPIVFVHGFGCAHTDWDAQVAHLSPRHQTVAVDLRGHGASPGSAAECSIERYGADVAEVLRALALPPAVLVGHSMGCRVVTEAALQAPAHTAGVILVDGSQFAASMEAVLRERFATADGYAAMVKGLFTDMFTAEIDPARGRRGDPARRTVAASDRGEDADRYATLRRRAFGGLARRPSRPGHGDPIDLQQRKT